MDQPDYKLPIFSIQESMIDFPGKTGITIFLPCCNFRCGFCHNSRLADAKVGKVDLDILLKNLKAKKNAGWYDGVCITGGEPTIYGSLPNFIKKIKDIGLYVKLDTNGSNPKMIESLVSEGLVDYIAMDVKGRKVSYPDLTKINYEVVSNLEKTMGILGTSGLSYEFRTTIAPILEDDSTRWISEKEIEEISDWILKSSKNKDSIYYIQKFVARGEEMIDKKYSRHSLPNKYHQTPIEVLENLKNTASKYLPNTKIR